MSTAERELRCAVDCAGKLVIAGRLFPAARDAGRVLAAPLAAGGAGIASVALAGQIGAAWSALALGLLALAGFAALALRSLLAEERRSLIHLLRHPRAALRRGTA